MLKVIAISEIRENPAALRGVNRQSEQFLGLVDSIREKGFIGSISVRMAQDPETKRPFYELIDGLHRFTASKEAGLNEINVDVINATDAEVLETQIMMNIHKVETKPVEYSKALLRMLAMNTMLTESELAKKLGKSLAWVKERLGLTSIENPATVSLIDDGKICLSNAYALCKLPEAEQANFIDRAITAAPDEFIPTVNQRVKELKDAKVKGRDAAPSEFAPVAHLQKLSVIKDEMAVSGATVFQIAQAHGISDPKALIGLTLSWVLNMDPVSVQAQKAKDDERRAIAKAAADKRALERAKKAAEKKMQEASELQLAVKDAAEAVS